MTTGIMTGNVTLFSFCARIDWAVYQQPPSVYYAVNMQGNLRAFCFEAKNQFLNFISLHDVNKVITTILILIFDIKDIGQ